MRRRLAYAVLMLLAMSLCLASCGRKRNIIPRKDLSDIYADLFLADKWSDSRPELRMTFDTTAYYEPILRKHGYSSEDYRTSVDYYLRDPERFSRILKRSAAKIARATSELEKYEGERREIESLMKRAAAAARKPVLFKDFLGEGPLPTDTIAFRVDSASGVWIIERIVKDTMYSGLEMIVRVDTTSVKDSVEVADTLPVISKDRRLLRPVDDTAEIEAGQRAELKSRMKILETDE